MKIEITEIKAKLRDTSNKEDWDVVIVFWEIYYHAYFPIGDTLQGHHVNGQIDWYKVPVIKEIKDYITKFYEHSDSTTAA